MPSVKILGLLVIEKILKVCTINGGNLGHATYAIYIHLRSHLSWMPHIKSVLNRSSGFERRFLKIVDKRQAVNGRRSMGIL